MSRRYESVKVDRLTPHPNNYRAHDLPAIAESLEANTQYRAIVASRNTGHVLAGNGTYLAARDLLGWTTIRVEWVDNLTDEEELRILAADNGTHERGQTNRDAITELLERLAETPDGLTGTGYGAAYLEEPKRGRTTIPLDEVPDLPGAPITNRGDVIHLGDHVLYCGDSLTDNLPDRLGLEHVDLVCTDPPYAVYGSATGLASDIADDKMIRPFCRDVARLAVDMLPWFGHAYIHCDWRTWPTWWDAAKAAHLTAKNLLVWDKGGSGLGSNYANTYELIGFFHKTPQASAMKSRDPVGTRSVFASNMLRYPRPAGDERLHNAAKPVDLLAALIENSTDPDQMVLDPFAGSGSTLIAAEQVGRRAVAVDVEPSWCDVIVNRWEAVTGGKAKR